LKEAVKSYSDQLKEKTPATLQPNQVALAKLQMAQGQAASTSKMISTIIPAVIRDTGATTRNAATNKTRENVADTTANARMEAATTTANAHYSAAVDAASIAANSRLKVAGINKDAAWDRTVALIRGRMAVAKQHGADSVKMLNVMQGNNKIWNKYIEDAQNQKKWLDTLHANKKMSDGEYQKKSSYLDGQIKEAQDKVQAGSTYVNSVATSSIGGNDGDTSGRLNSEQDSPNSGSTTEHAGATTDTDPSEDKPDYYGQHKDNPDNF
jgi:hypothetical protein